MSYCVMRNILILFDPEKLSLPPGPCCVKTHAPLLVQVAKMGPGDKANKSVFYCQYGRFSNLYKSE